MKRAPHFDPQKFENVLQVGGITTGTFDAPGPGGPAGGRVTWIDTGAGLRFLVALDRGGDIVNATFNEFALAYLSPNGLSRPSHAYHSGAEWLRNWPGGLVTTCGPEYIGRPRADNGQATSLHGRFSNTPAVVTSVRNPDPKNGRLDFQLDLVIRDTRVFGPNFEIRRSLQCTLGSPELTLRDHVINCGDTTAAHHWLYHCNFGYPLLDEGARFIYRGRAKYWSVPAPGDHGINPSFSRDALNKLKSVPSGLAEHRGGGERGVVVSSEPGRDGTVQLGLINERIGVGVEMTFPAKSLPRFAHWQHYGPTGAYVSALEPFYGSLMGSASDQHLLAKSTLKPGQSRNYELRLRVLRTPAEMRNLIKVDGPVVPERQPIIPL